MRELLLIGASGLAREVLSALQHDSRVIGILDDDPGRYGTRVSGVEVLGALHLAAELDADLLVCVGSGATRRGIIERLGALGVADDRFATLIDASVRVPSSCTVGRGSIILANTVMTADVTLGRHVVIMPQCTLTHDDVLEDCVTLAAATALGGGVTIESDAYLGMNVSIRQYVTVGSGAVVGMGAVVLSDVPAGETWVGAPARLSGARTR